MKQTFVTLVDDLDGSDADEEVRFAIDGMEYTIDLSEKNAAKLRAVFEPYCAAGQRMGRTARTASRTLVRFAGSQQFKASSPQSKERNAAIRTWAHEQGLAVSDRGRISQDIVERYDAEQAAPKPAAAKASSNGTKSTKVAAGPVFAAAE